MRAAADRQHDQQHSAWWLTAGRQPRGWQRLAWQGEAAWALLLSASFSLPFSSLLLSLSSHLLSQKLSSIREAWEGRLAGRTGGQAGRQA